MNKLTKLIKENPNCKIYLDTDYYEFYKIDIPDDLYNQPFEIQEKWRKENIITFETNSGVWDVIYALAEISGIEIVCD